MMAGVLLAFKPGTEPTPGTDHWLDLVDSRLLDGFGVEDIAIWLNFSPGRIRRHVQSLRRTGAFDCWWGF